MTLSIVWLVLYWGWVVSEVAVGIGTRTKRSGGKVQDRGSLVVMWVVVVASMTACNWIGEIGPWNMLGGAHWLKTAGVIVIATGLGIRSTAIVTLGESFSSNVAILDSQKVMRKGPYRFVRHPSYLGLLLGFVAAGVHSRNWIALASAVVPTTTAMLYRIHVEELALNAAFGEEYSSYSRETKRLLPGIY